MENDSRNCDGCVPSYVTKVDGVDGIIPAAVLCSRFGRVNKSGSVAVMCPHYGVGGQNE